MTVHSIDVVPSTNKTAAEGAFATIRRVSGGSSDHYQEGNSTGGFKWDPIDGAEDTGRNLNQIRNVFITPKPTNE